MDNVLAYVMAVLPHFVEPQFVEFQFVKRQFVELLQHQTPVCRTIFFGILLPELPELQ
jgi:hypothetical protein